MSGRTRLRFGFDLAILAVFVYAAIDAASFSALARYMPLYVSCAGIFLSLVNLGADVWRLRGASTPGGFHWTSPEDYVDPAAGPGEAELFQRQFYYLGWIFGYVALIALTGILAATTLFTVAFLRREARMRWGWIFVSLAIVLATLIGFSELLNLRWPSNLLGNVLGR